MLYRRKHPNVHNKKKKLKTEKKVTLIDYFLVPKLFTTTKKYLC